MINYIKKHWLVILGGFVGAIAGYSYWKYVGCYSGTCGITSDPLNSTLYGTALGGLIFSTFKNEKTKAA